MARIASSRTYKQDIYNIQPSDLFETPDYAIDPLYDHIKSEWIIWEPACGSGRIVNYFQTRDIDCFGTDLQTGFNFLTDHVDTDDFDCIVTNPPYSLKFHFMRRCYELGNPFALLVPVECIGTGQAQSLMKRHGFQMLLFNRRVRFFTQSGKDSNPQMPTMWFCWRVLPQPVMYANINPDN